MSNHQRIIAVVFVADGETQREEYGPFTTTDGIVRWIEYHDDHGTFGPYVQYTIRRLAKPSTT